MSLIDILTLALLRLLNPGPLILECNGAIEYEPAAAAVRVNVEIAQPFELVSIQRLCTFQ